MLVHSSVKLVSLRCLQGSVTAETRLRSGLKRNRGFIPIHSVQGGSEAHSMSTGIPSLRINRTGSEADHSDLDWWRPAANNCCTQNSHRKKNPSSRRRGGPTSKHINAFYVVRGPDWARNDEWLCWRRPTANYCSALLWSLFPSSYPCTRPWRPIGLWDVEGHTVSRQSAHRWR
jgi:hypothetical protein